MPSEGRLALTGLQAGATGHATSVLDRTLIRAKNLGQIFLLLQIFAAQSSNMRGALTGNFPKFLILLRESTTHNGKPAEKLKIKCYLGKAPLYHLIAVIF